MTRRLAPFALALALAAGLAPTTAAPATAAPAQHHRPTTPCAAEDGPGPCLWDAHERGNHHGRSFWIDRHGAIHYLHRSHR